MDMLDNRNGSILAENVLTTNRRRCMCIRDRSFRYDHGYPLSVNERGFSNRMSENQTLVIGAMDVSTTYHVIQLSNSSDTRRAKIRRNKSLDARFFGCISKRVLQLKMWPDDRRNNGVDAIEHIAKLVLRAVQVEQDNVDTFGFQFGNDGLL